MTELSEFPTRRTPSHPVQRWLRGGLAAALALPSLTACSVVGRMDWGHPFSRQGWQRTDLVLENLSLAPGDVVADLGAGDGYFSFVLAEAVGPEGRVYAVDIDPAPLAKLRREIDRRGVTNIEIIHGTARDSALPPGLVDLVFLCNAYHHFEDRVEYFARLRGLLAADARVVVLDGRPDGFASWLIPKGHWLEPGELAAEMSAAGFHHKAAYDLLPLNTFDVFEAPGTGDTAHAEPLAESIPD